MSLLKNGIVGPIKRGTLLVADPGWHENTHVRGWSSSRKRELMMLQRGTVAEYVGRGYHPTFGPHEVLLRVIVNPFVLLSRSGPEPKRRPDPKDTLIVLPVDWSVHKPKGKS